MSIEGFLRKHIPEPQDKSIFIPFSGKGEIINTCRSLNLAVISNDIDSIRNVIAEGYTLGVATDTALSFIDELNKSLTGLMHFDVVIPEGLDFTDENSRRIIYCRDRILEESLESDRPFLMGSLLIHAEMYLNSIKRLFFIRALHSIKDDPREGSEVLKGDVVEETFISGVDSYATIIRQPQGVSFISPSLRVVLGKYEDSIGYPAFTPKVLHSMLKSVNSPNIFLIAKNGVSNTTLDVMRTIGILDMSQLQNGELIFYLNRS